MCGVLSTNKGRCLQYVLIERPHSITQFKVKPQCDTRYSHFFIPEMLVLTFITGLFTSLYS